MDHGKLLLRDLQSADRPSIERILTSCGAFRDDEIVIGMELVDESLNPGPATDYRWVLADRGGLVVGFACFGAVPLTEGTFDLYWIAVSPEAQHSGVARRLDEAVTAAVEAQGGRWLLAETSSTQAYEAAHRFYLRQGYQPLERISDFYRNGDDRLTFGKRLDQG